MRFVFMGTPDFAVPTLRALCAAAFPPTLVVTQPPARRRRRGETESSPLGNAARELGLELLETPDVGGTKDDAECSALERAQPELIVVVAFGSILSGNVLGLPRYGCINLHPSMLPRYRGAAPIQRAIIDGVEESGLTVMKLVKRLDAGPILAQRPFRIGPDERADEASARAAELGAEMVVEVVRACAAGQPPVERAQDDAQATYAAMLEKSDGALNLTQPARRVWNRIRGVQPWPGARVFHHAERITPWAIHRAAPTGRATDREPGTIVGVSKDGIEAACGGDTLLITELQLPGKPRRAVAAFLNGFPVNIGERLTRD